MEKDGHPDASMLLADMVDSLDASSHVPLELLCMSCTADEYVGSPNRKGVGSAHRPILRARGRLW